MKILLIFTLCLISDGGAFNEVTGYSGGDVLIKCKYETKYTKRPKYFCKGSRKSCSVQIKTQTKNQWVNSGRFSLFDDTESVELWVMIRELTVQDTGMYQCGVDLPFGTDIYTPVVLNVIKDLFQLTPASPPAGFPAYTAITVSLILLLLLIGILILSVTFQRRCRMRDPKTTRQAPKEMNEDYETDLNVFPLQSAQSTNLHKSVDQNMDPNANQSDSVYQTLNPNTNQSDSVYQTLNLNTFHQIQSIKL